MNTGRWMHVPNGRRSICWDNDPMLSNKGESRLGLEAASPTSVSNTCCISSNRLMAKKNPCMINSSLLWVFDLKCCLFSSNKASAIKGEPNWNVMLSIWLKFWFYRYCALQKFISLISSSLDICWFYYFLHTITLFCNSCSYIVFYFVLT